MKGLNTFREGYCSRAGGPLLGRAIGVFSVAAVTPESPRKEGFADAAPQPPAASGAQWELSTGRSRTGSIPLMQHTGGTATGVTSPGAAPTVSSQHFAISSSTPRCGQRAFIGEVTVFQDTRCNCHFSVKHSTRTCCLKLCFTLCCY